MECSPFQILVAEFGTDHIEKAVFVTSASIFSEIVGGMKLKFDEEIEKQLIYQDPSPFRWDFQYFCVNFSLKWRRSRLTAAKLQALSPSYVLTRLNRHRPKLISLEDALHGTRRRKNTIHESIKVSFNFIGIFRPRCDLDVQFSGLYS